MKVNLFNEWLSESGPGFDFGIDVAGHYFYSGAAIAEKRVRPGWTIPTRADKIDKISTLSALAHLKIAPQLINITKIIKRHKIVV